MKKGSLVEETPDLDYRQQSLGEGKHTGRFD